MRDKGGMWLSYLRSDEFWDRLVEIQKSHNLSGWGTRCLWWGDGRRRSVEVEMLVC